MPNLHPRAEARGRTPGGAEPRIALGLALGEHQMGAFAVFNEFSASKLWTIMDILNLKNLQTFNDNAWPIEVKVHPCLPYIFRPIRHLIFH